MEVRFTLRQLEYFTATVEQGTFRAAAAQCRVSETALAQAVTDLETALGQTLFLRQRSRGVVPTAEGLTLLALSRSLLDQATELASAANDLRSGLTGPLRIGCYSILSPFIVPSILGDFASRNEGLDVSIVEGEPHHLQELLLEGKLDCVLILHRQGLPHVEIHAVRPQRARVVLSEEHRLAGRRSVSLTELEGEPMIFLDQPAVRSGLLPILEAIGVQPTIRLRTTVFETVRSLVARNLGWAILHQQPPLDLSYEGRRVRYLRIEDPIPSNDVCLGVLRGRRWNARLVAFEEFCIERFRQMDEAQAAADVAPEPARAQTGP